MNFTTLIIAAIATATFTVASPVAAEVNEAGTAIPPPLIPILDCTKCKSWEDKCRRVSRYLHPSFDQS
jgi:hypothetical protein